MAEKCARAFGRYLKLIRERRSLSMDDVRSLSQTFPDPITKSYLSRVENGHQSLAFSKLVPLSRIYEVPADVLLERMEMDLELERLGGPKTEGFTYPQLLKKGIAALRAGERWKQYGFMRDASVVACLEPLDSSADSPAEQSLLAQMRCAIAARGLGHSRFALHEFEQLKDSSTLKDKHRAFLLERIAMCYRMEGKLDLAEEFITHGITQTEKLDDRQYLAACYDTRAHIALERKDPEVALEYYLKAHKMFAATGQEYESTRILLNLSEVYLQLGRVGAARRAAQGSLRSSTQLRYLRLRALALMRLGELDARDKKPRSALTKWRSASTLARKASDRELRFKAELMLFKHAAGANDASTARAVRRRLDRLSPWLPLASDDLQEYRQLIEQRSDLMKR